MVVLIIVAALLVIMGIVILAGKGDNLIAGYNTASKKEREEYDIKRLRLLIGGFLIVLAPMLFLIAGEPSISTSMSFCALVAISSIVIVVLANTWAKKKKR